MLAYPKLRVCDKNLIIEGLLFSSRTIRLEDVQSIEVYTKSIVPPLVISIFLLVLQATLFYITRDLHAIDTIFFRDFALLSLNIPIMLCVATAILRSKLVTLKITLQDMTRPLIIRLVSRSAGEQAVKHVQSVINPQ